MIVEGFIVWLQATVSMEGCILSTRTWFEIDVLARVPSHQEDAKRCADEGSKAISPIIVLLHSYFRCQMLVLWPNKWGGGVSSVPACVVELHIEQSCCLRYLVRE